MIILPNVLIELLREAGDQVQWRLAIAYARHTVQVSENGEAIDRYAAILDRADALLNAGKPPVESRTLLSEFYSIDDGEGFEDARATIHVALNACFEREFESTRPPNQRMPLMNATVVDVAKLAQKAVGRFETSAEAQRAARWEEARWQLLQLIAEVPLPSRGVSDGS